MLMRLMHKHISVVIVMLAIAKLWIAYKPANINLFGYVELLVALAWAYCQRGANAAGEGIITAKLNKNVVPY